MAEEPAHFRQTASLTKRLEKTEAEPRRASAGWREVTGQDKHRGQKNTSTVLPAEQNANTRRE